MCLSGSRQLPPPGIKIRHFRDEDKEQVQGLFRRGIMSLVPSAFYRFARSPGYLLLAVSLGGTLAWALQAQIHFLITLFVVFLAMLILMYCICNNAFLGYVQYSIESDLSDIQNVYVKSGGCFLVAVVPDHDDGNDFKERIVGTVAAEGKGSHKFELRRMSVCQSMQGLGLGKALIRQLEKECKTGTIFLTTSNVQYTAIALYSKYGFRRMPKTESYGTGLFGLLTSFELYFFEKEF